MKFYISHETMNTGQITVITKFVPIVFLWNKAKLD